MSIRIRISRGITAACLFGFASAAFAGGWPISFVNVKVSSGFGVSTREPERDCQPEFFDPKTTAYHPVPSATVPATKPASGVSPAAPAAPAVKTYQVEGAEPGETMTINSRVKPDDEKIDLPGQIMLTRYIFSCPTGSSEALVFEKKDNKPYAIFNHVAQVRFTPDFDTVVFYNRAKLTHHGGWTKMRAIFNIRKKRFAPMAVMAATDYLGAVSSKTIVTSSLPAKQGARATVAVWNMGGKLMRALSVPLHVSADGKRISDAFGVLPADQGTFYHLSRSGENSAVLRLQDIRHAHAHRAIALTVPGAADEPVVADKGVQLDLSALTLKGGAVKYRVSADGKGDDWGQWQTAE